jgi:hypothetical protein
MATPTRQSNPGPTAPPSPPCPIPCTLSAAGRATIHLPDSFDLSTITSATSVRVILGTDYRISKTLASAAKSKITTPAKGGSATFLTKEDKGGGKMVTTETVSISWSKKKVLTVKVTGKPLLDSDKNIVDLINQADGKVSGLRLPCEVDFANTVGNTVITYGGKKSTKTPKGSTTGLVSWNVSGKK